ncbi:uncharacterized protein LOC129579452 [Sitodiplosis mosellana]|uniref:uncharacterized protein LOC129579452 n=1 Tax=Sitodiplosis mosellana TaxID=263140 RepID=UPI002444B792|nr:uncharacterized protein LOC129579452 [Sitodiplosis mosellana]XP_055325517.1 uncharacterized protein LOC129579452 [Sitodiplosis mosellana]XP_055325518.1 uncharacterized protein LOC129579452 [Sitodiplosis mosellana]
MSKKSDYSIPKRNVRKVRFELPTNLAIDSDDNGTHFGATDSKKSDKFLQKYPSKFVATSKKDEKKVHGTGNYVNGTLSFSTTDYAAMQRNNVETCTATKKETKSIPIMFRNQFTNDASAKNARKNCSIDQQYWENAVHRRGILLHVSSDNQEANKITFRTSKMRRYTSIFMGSSKYFKRSRSQLLNYPKTKSPNTLELPTNQPLKKEDFKPMETQFEKFSYKLIPTKSNAIKLTQANSNEPQPSDFDVRALSIVRNAFNQQQNELPHHCTSENLSEILQLAHRWQSSSQSVPASDNVSTRESSHSVEFCTLKKLDVKIANSGIRSGSDSNRFVHTPLKSTKMNKDKVSLVTTLLRASRSQDEDTLRHVLENILRNGISEAELNAEDCSGRTALSYMCSTNTTHFLEALLQVPGIDINKPDNELNTPLHYAAECGHLGAIRLLLPQNKLNIDAKNIFGFTPLMKAAIQGHIRCAKTLLFAGSSPVEIDYKRQLRAEQWARFCGRHSCAELIEKWARTRNLDKESFSIAKDQDSHDSVTGRARANSAVQTISKVNITPIKSDKGIRSKISKVFNFVSRDKSSNQNRSNHSSSNNNIKDSSKTGFSVYQKGITMLSRSDGFLNKSVVRPLEVPKLEVTSPHNQELIRKYEKRYSLGNNENAKPPALPPRRSSKQIF